MCGIAGHLRLRPENSEPISAHVAAEMLAAIRRRGPDGEGEWRSRDGLCWLGHRRLAIIDLHGGDQPMCNEDGTIWTVFNGEIYNHASLRTELEAQGHRFGTRSDTEVLVHGYEQWGLRRLAERLQGIFAFAVYDAVERTLSLARDPMGVKPLYWWCDGNELLFASEMKSMLRHPALRSRKVNRAGIAQVLVTRYVSRPRTMFDGLSRLPEGCCMAVDVNGRVPAAPQRYWDVRYRSEQTSLEEATEQLDALLKRTVDMQLMSDVPLGVQLSGGVDSSLVVGVMEGLRRERGDSERVKTFSVGFDVPEFSELGYARKVAERYGTEHHEITVGFRDFAEELPFLAWLYDEPMGEPPGIPTYFMCREAKRHVSVMLCGEGADEQFGGYSKYTFERFSAALDWMAPGIRNALLRGLAGGLPFEGRRLRSVGEILGIADAPRRFASWYGGFDTALQARVLSDRMRKEIGDGGLAEAFRKIVDACDSTNALDRFLYCDSHTRLVDDILVKCDRMSMGAGIEARVPFLDHKLVEFAARLPRHLKVSGLSSKIALKRLAERYLPGETIYRRKVGFTVPLTRWFVGPWRGLIDDVLLSDRCLDRGYYDADAVRRIVGDHVRGRVDREQGIWLMLALEIWHRLFVDEDGSEAAVARVKADFELSLAGLQSPPRLPERAASPVAVAAGRRRTVLFGPSLDAVSGVSTHLRMLLASDLSQDYDLLHFQVGSEGRREKAFGKLLRLTLSPLRLALLLLRTGAEIVHLNTSLGQKAYWRDLSYWIIARLLGRRVVNQIHGGAMPQDFFRGKALLTWILRRFLVSSDAVTVLSSAELSAYRAFDPRIRIHLVPNAIEPAGLADQVRTYNADRPLRLVYVGRLVRAKGLFEAIEALTELKRAGHQFRFSIAGHGQDQGELMAASERAGLEDCVRFLGCVFAAEKRRLWLDSDVFVFPTHFEGLPYSLLEAMAAGCVPVTTRVAAIPDVMRGGEHGLFVPVRDARALARAVAALDDDRECLIRLAEAARRRVVEKYTVARLADDFRKLYAGCFA